MGNGNPYESTSISWEFLFCFRSSREVYIPFLQSANHCRGKDSQQQVSPCLPCLKGKIATQNIHIHMLVYVHIHCIYILKLYITDIYIICIYIYILCINTSNYIQTYAIYIRYNSIYSTSFWFSTAPDSHTVY